MLITSGYFPEDGVVGLGTQLASIVKSITTFLPQHMWYGADVEAVGTGANKHNLNSVQLRPIGTDRQLIDYCSEIEQFIWGVFLCLAGSVASHTLQGIELETEDPPFRSIPCDRILMEIRAFDTTYFGIYSEDLEFMKKVAKIYAVPLQLCAQQHPAGALGNDAAIHSNVNDP